ncbi:MAG: hypothetical protein NXI00_20030 [Cytophagales bacterium]|nr:hypothetical protein [Cytophagales bacterium]
MAGMTYTEPIILKTAVITADGQGGGDVSSFSEVQSTLATIVEKPANRFLNDTTDFKYSQTITFWKDPSFEIDQSTVVEWRGKRLSIQSIEFNDTVTKCTLKTAR